MPKFFGLFDSNEKEIKRLKSYIDRTNELEPEYQKLTDEELKAKTAEFKARVKEAGAGVQSKVEEARQELQEAQECLAKATWEDARDEADNQCKRAREKVDQVEKERQKLEREALNDILPEAFAAVREAARRAIGQRHYDVQLYGGVTLHLGKIAEMRTGEGKTLVATLPLYLNSLTGRGAHLATVNDYLARRDPYWMGPIFHALGVSVASIYPMQKPDEQMPSRIFDPAHDSGDEKDPWRHFRPVSRKEAYEADITYGTSAEFGFDFLRDNMVSDLSQCVQRSSLYYCIVDEVDNLLIDEARTPLIISAPDTESGLLYQKFAALVTRLKRDEDYEIKEKEQSADLNENGWDRVEMMLKRDGLLKSGDSLYNNGTLMHHLRNALSAKEFYKRDQRYVVENGEVIIVDEFTGRKMYGRRYSEGLHQAIEAKEHIKVQQETRTYATVTIQNYFRMYEKLGGMTGTAATEAEEFFKIYKLEVTEIPTNKPMIREDLPDQIYKTEEGKYRAVAEEIKELHEKGVPVLVGTVSIENSVRLSDILKRQGITCQVLNAKEHTREAAIVSRAGEMGAVTVATNMAGRGVDIILGGAQDGVSQDEWQKKHDKVIELGGLHIIGTERHEARRIDNQLRGRAGRQGDPGSTRFYISLEDDIMRRFGGDRMKTVMGWVGLDDETPIENKMITNMITDVQKRVEGYHFDVRKNLVEYDDVVNTQRGLIYQERRKILSDADLKSNILDMVRKELSGIVASHNANRTEDENAGAPALLTEINRIIPLPADLTPQAVAGMSGKELEQKFCEIAEAAYDSREAQMGADKMRLVERLVMLQIIDRLWVELLTEMDRMRLQASLDTMRQMRSADSYKMIGSEKFNELKAAFQQDVAGMIFHVSITEKHQAKAPQSPMEKAGIGSKGDSNPAANSGSRKVGRNEPCPCGSGKKYKHCHGK
ncbi:MAG: preprotein translocase subunit SecA [Dehalococcoidales bacterium]|jgi:preprotein translocase subunit SecA